MLSRQRLFHLIALVLVLMLVLVACERPVPGGDSTDSGTTMDAGEVADTDTADDSDADADSSDEAVSDTEPADDAEADSTEADAEVDAEATEAPAPVEATDAESSDDSTPRVEEEVTSAEEGAAEASTDESDAADATLESDAAEKEDKADESEAAEADEPEEAATETETEAVDQAAEVETSMVTSHVVAPGENLYRIGLLYNVSWITLAEINGVGNANKIVVGQVLEIPGDPPEGPEPTPSPLTETTYTVRANDNLYTIGLAYGINWIQIAEANGLVNPNQIIVGQVLKIPVDTPGPAPQFTHKVMAGETLFLISLRYGVAWPVIAEANDLGSPYVIYSGQTLVIPGGP
jgi:LysM repeat protein